MLAALREAWHEEFPKPLSDKEIRMMLAEDVSSENIAVAVLERGIDFQATPGYLEALRSEGAKDGLIDTLRAAAPRPFSKDELLQLLATRVDQAWIAPKIQERGIDFTRARSTSERSSTRGAGAAPGSCSHRQAHQAFCGALPAAPKGVHRSGAREASRSHLRSVKQDVPIFSDPHDIGIIVDRLRCGDHVIFLEKTSAPPGFDKVHYAVGKDGYVADSYLAAPLATPGEGVTAPIPNYKPEPGYTPEARRG